MARWSPLILPETRDAMLAAAARSERQLRDRGLTSLADQLHVDQVQLGHPYLMWISRDMTRLALDASSDLPEWTPGVTAPHHAGLMVWEGGMPSVPWVDSYDRRREVTVDGVRWATYGGHVHVRVLTRAEPIRDGLSPSWHHCGLFAIWGLQLPAATPVTELPPDLWQALREHRMTRTQARHYGESLIHAIGATWLLSQQPTLAHMAREWRDPDRNRRGKPPRPTPDVTIVDLRIRQPVTRADVDPDLTGPARTYRHRWVVRGHWTQQAYGPQRSLRRPQWIDSYIAGPDSAPLLATEHVHVWRR